MRRIVKTAVAISAFVLTVGSVSYEAGAGSADSRTALNINAVVNSTVVKSNTVTGKKKAADKKKTPKKVTVKAPTNLKREYVNNIPCITWKKRKPNDKVDIWCSRAKDGEYRLKETTKESFYDISEFKKGSLVYIKLKTKRKIDGKNYRSGFSCYMTLVTSVKV